ncbi:hypothetical protein EUX98_g9190 [Antrodiella citrinella]|uniref:Ubiquitin-like protease family profile domain-containing protein n=1 Tax=Antrodiella citrinella TaxID=2447956 RepID=A0A4S4LXH5_9APHY|nr:hypothetical protein EUX98_g9190 [Antrodiella citrinella]
MAIEQLHIYLSDEYLFGGHIDQQLSFLRDKLFTHGNILATPPTIVGIDFMDSLLKAKANKSSYQLGKVATLIHDLGVSLRDKTVTSIGGLLHVHGNHYTIFVVDVIGHFIGYGDSFRDEMPSEIRDALTWWVAESMGLDASTIETSWFRELPVTRQKDGFSCGVLALNALGHHFLSTEIPLIVPGERKAVAFERMKMLIAVFDAYANYVSKVYPYEPGTELPLRSMSGCASEQDVPGRSEPDVPIFSMPPEEMDVSDSGLSDHHLNHLTESVANSSDGDMISVSELFSPPHTPFSDRSADSAASDQESSSVSGMREDLPADLERSSTRGPASYYYQTRELSGNTDLRLDDGRFESDDELEYADDPAQAEASEFEPDSGDGEVEGSCNGNIGSLASVERGAAASRETKHSERNSGIVPKSTVPTHPQQRSLAAFFAPVSTAEWLAQEKLRSEVRALEVAEQRESEEVLRQKYAEKKREDARLRQQAFRQRKQRKRSQEESNGQSKQSGSSKAPNKRLKQYDDDDTSTAVAPNFAESSRPRRGFKESLKTKNTKIGRPRTKKATVAQRMNWMQPHIFEQIDAATKATGYPWRPVDIVQRLQRSNPRVFANLKHQRLSEWRDRTILDRFVWKDAVLARTKKGNQPGGENTRLGILHAYPEVVARIKKMLYDLRDASIPLTSVSVRAIIVSCITHDKPELFARKDENGKQRFCCSESFVHRFIKRSLGWSLRRGTRAGQKIPQDADLLLKRAHLRIAAVIRDQGVPDCLIVNSDQTQVIYSAGGAVTYEKTGAKQVAIVGAEEKRAFTLLPEI